MPLTRRGARTATVALSPELRTIFLDGPYVLDKTLHQIPPHDELRRLWAIHGAALKALRPGRRVWFEERDAFVAMCRGER